MWLDGEENIGDRRFLVSIFNTSNADTIYRLRTRPARTNRSHEAKLRGWCGETNNRSVTAEGAVVVVARTAHGRVRVRALRGADLAAFLLAEGWPELVPRVAGEGSS